MNNHDGKDQDGYRSLLLMNELDEGRPISQREIAVRLGIALGLVNSYLKTLVGKGYVQVKAFPRNRYAYLLTPQGLAEKSRLAYRHLSNFHTLYRITRQDSLNLFHSLRRQGEERVAFCGLDDLTEIAYLSLREAGMELASVMDEEGGARFIGLPVIALGEGVTADVPIVITSVPRADRLRCALQDLGVEERRIFSPSYNYAEIFR